MAMYGEDDSRTPASSTSKPTVPPLFLDKKNSVHHITSPRATSLPHSSIARHPLLSPRPNSWSCDTLPALSPRSQSSPLSPRSWQSQRYLPRLEAVLPEYWRDKSEVSLLSPWEKLDPVEFKDDLSPATSSSPSSSSEQNDDRPDFTARSEDECISVLSSSFKETIQHLKIDFIPTVTLLRQTLGNLSSLNYLYFNFHLSKKSSDSSKHTLRHVRHKYLTLSKQDAIDLSPETILQLLQGNEQALQVIRMKASEGVQATQYVLGQIYENHQIIPEGIKGENETNPLLWYKQAKDNAGAQYNLGRYYLTKANSEAGTPRIKGWRDEAFELFRLAADRGHRKAQFRLAEDAFVREKNEEEAFRLFKSSAKQGYTKAQAYLGWMYANKNMSKAVLWLKKAAHKGHLVAQYNLAIIYKNPRIQYAGQLPQEARTQDAFRLLTEAAGRSLKEAYLPLGDLYYENQGISVEMANSERIDEAWKWYQLSAEGGEVEAKFKLALMCLCEEKVEVVGTKKWFLDEIDPLFFIWFVHTYPQGFGETSRENDEKAIGWLQEATERHTTPRHGKQYWQLPTMQFALGWMYMHGRVQDKKSKDEHDAIAVGLLHNAASQGLREAQFSLGKMYWEGRVVGRESSENDSVAFDLFNEAAKNDFVEALFYLGEMHWEGHVEGGLSIDNRMKATEWYNKARNKGLKKAGDKLKTILSLPI